MIFGKVCHLHIDIYIIIIRTHRRRILSFNPRRGRCIRPCGQMPVIRANHFKLSGLSGIEFLRQQILEDNIALFEVWRIYIGNIVADDFLPEICCLQPA